MKNPSKPTQTVSKWKEILFPALAGLDLIDQANLSATVKQYILKNYWQNPHASRKAYKWLKEMVTDMEASYGEIPLSDYATLLNYNPKRGDIT